MDKADADGADLKAASLIHSLKNFRPGLFTLNDERDLLNIFAEIEQCLANPKSARLFMSESFMELIDNIIFKCSNIQILERIAQIYYILALLSPNSFVELCNSKRMNSLMMSILNITDNSSDGAFVVLVDIILLYMRVKPRKITSNILKGGFIAKFIGIIEKAKEAEEKGIDSKENIAERLPSVNSNVDGKENKQTEVEVLSDVLATILIHVFSDKAFKLKFLPKSDIEKIIDFATETVGEEPIGVCVSTNLELLILMIEKEIVPKSTLKTMCLRVLYDVYCKLLVAAKIMVVKRGSQTNKYMFHVSDLDNMIRIFGLFMFLDHTMVDTMGSPSVRDSRVFDIMNFIINIKYRKEPRGQKLFPDVDSLLHLIMLYFVESKTQKEHVSLSGYYTFLENMLLCSNNPDWQVIFDMTSNINEMYKGDEEIDQQLELDVYRNNFMDCLSENYIQFCCLKLESMSSMSETVEYAGLAGEVKRYINVVFHEEEGGDNVIEKYKETNNINDDIVKCINDLKTLKMENEVKREKRVSKKTCYVFLIATATLTSLLFIMLVIVRSMIKKTGVCADLDDEIIL